MGTVVGSCPTGKAGHDSRRAAKAHARQVHPGVHLRAFDCPHCAYWHLGTVPAAVLAGVDPSRPEQAPYERARRPKGATL